MQEAPATQGTTADGEACSSSDASDEHVSEGCADPAPVICESTDAASGDASLASDGQATLFVTPFKLEPSGGCLPQPLPSDGSGTTCRVLLSGVGDGCQQPGLMPAAPEDVAKIDERFMALDASLPLTSTLCAITQLPAATTANAGCANPAAYGWCYVEGSCSAGAGASCQQNICTTSAYASEGLVYTGALLVCP